MNFRIFCFYLLFFSVLFSCSHENRIDNTIIKSSYINVSIEYAKYFSIKEYESYKLLEIKNPWKENEILQRIVVLDSNSSFDSTFSEEYQVVRLPINRVAIQSVSNIGFLNLLNNSDLIKGVTDPHLIYSENIIKQYKSGGIACVGTSMEISKEKIIAGNFDLFIATSYNGDDKYSILEKNNIPVLFNVDWMENHPLGRAEWIKCIALFTAQEKMGDSIFNSIESEYNKIKNISNSLTSKPKILVATSFKGTWYVPGGKSFKAILFKDAGADYFWASDNSTGSLALSLEKVFAKQSDASIWIDVAAKSKQELLLQDNRYKLFQAYQKGKIYNNFLAVNKDGGNNYWEEGVCRPDFVLSDLIHIFHPELFDEMYGPHYYTLIK